MLNPNTPSSPHTWCGECNFALFCGADESCKDQSHALPMIVKQTTVIKRHEGFNFPKDKLQRLYAVQKGALKTFQIEADGREIVKGFYFAGEIFGYEAIFTGRYPFHAIALADTVICEISYDDFLDLLQSKPALQKHILFLISQQLTNGAYLALNSAEQRVAGFLLDLFSRLKGGKLTAELILPMSRQDMGNYLRLTAETISRVCSRLQKHHIIAIDRKKIQLLKPALLKQMAEAPEHLSAAG